MKINPGIQPAILAGASTLLAPFVPDLTPRTLVEALKAYGADATPKPVQGVTMREAAKRLGVCEMTVYRMVKAGQLPTARFAGRTVRVPAAALDALLSGTTTTPAA